MSQRVTLPIGETERLAAVDALAVIADRLQVIDPRTGIAVWTPGRGDADGLAAAVSRWLFGDRQLTVDPTDPLTYLLDVCACRAHRIGKVVDCPIHGRRRLRRRPWVTRRGTAERRRRQVVDLVAKEGSLAAAARVLGVSYQRVQQIIGAAADTEDTNAPLAGGASEAHVHKTYTEPQTPEMSLRTSSTTEGR